MVYYLLSRSNLVTFVAVILLCHRSNAFLKQFLGAALMGDVGSAAISSITCTSLGDNFSRFTLYTRRKTEAFTLSTKNTTLHRSNFDPSIPTKIIIHGFLDSNLVSDWMINMKNVLLQEGNYNVIIMDWSCANGFPYFKAVRNAKIAATHLHRLLLSLKGRGANFSDMHLIGHSLGSQIAGIVGYHIQKQKLGRISGLDPAGPMFYDVPVQERIDRTDALFVDIIHTDGGSNLLEGLGLSKHSGHVDFYPNGGQTQPNCHSSPLDVIERIGLGRTARYFLTCDHYQAINLYIESIKQKIYSRNGEDHCQYVGIKCPNWETFAHGRCVDCLSSERCAVMGYNSDKYFHGNIHKSANNVFFLKTANEEPYCVYQYGITMVTGSRFALRKALYNYTNDVMTLEVVNKEGGYVQLKLNERREDYLKASTKYTYLVISRNRIRSVESASMWLGTEGKPRSRSPKRKIRIGVRIKKVIISPIEVNTDKRQSKKIVLCGEKNNILTKGEVLKLSAHC